jgi:hypothetical protein
MNGGLSLLIATSWTPADQSPPLLDALRFGNDCSETVKKNPESF